MSARPPVLFLAFQISLEISSVAAMNFLRTALNAKRNKRGELLTPQFIKKVRAVSGKLGANRDMLRRAVNVGFSCGEKKRNEILEIALLKQWLPAVDCRASFAITRAPRCIFWRMRS